MCESLIRDSESLIQAAFFSSLIMAGRFQRRYGIASGCTADLQVPALC
jgi:hypothetical protein